MTIFLKNANCPMDCSICTSWTTSNARKTEYVKVIKDKCGGNAAYGPPYLTHAWAPLDCGHINATIKAIAKNKFDAFKEEPDVAHLGKSKKCQGKSKGCPQMPKGKGKGKLYDISKAMRQGLRERRLW